MTHKQYIGKIVILELEVSFIVKLKEGRAVGVEVLEVDVVALGVSGGVAALLTHVHLAPALLVGVLMGLAVHLQAVRLQGAALRERLLAQVALVGADAWEGLG